MIDDLNKAFDDCAGQLPSLAERLRWVFGLHFDLYSRGDLIEWAITRGYSRKGAENRYGETRAFLIEVDGFLAS